MIFAQLFHLFLLFFLPISGPAADREYSRPPDTELKKLLTPEQYRCTQEAGTETPFHNAYWNNKADGIYVDIVSGEPLFSSLDKYDSHSGWPSFTKPLESNLKYREDTSAGVERTELLSKRPALI